MSVNYALMSSNWLGIYFLILYFTSHILRYAPVGILFLIAGKLLEMKDLLEVGGQLGMYMVCVIVGLLIHSVFVLPLLFYVGTRRNPFTFISGLLQALITAFGTSSRYLNNMLWSSRFIEKIGRYFD